MVIGLLGFGTVGGGVYEIVDKLPDLRVKYVCCLEEVSGLSARLTRDASEIFDDPEVDVVVEVMGGLHPAREFVLRAIEAGKHVVTANKLLIADYYEELTTRAKEKGVALRCTAAAGGGIPWLTALERCKRVDRITALSGIMNGTTNFILDTMHNQDAEFEDVLQEAQRLGYAEADPSADIDGLDILNKLVISANVAFNVQLDKNEAAVFGIRSITKDDIDTFRRHGFICKLVAAADHLGDRVCAVIEPTLLLPNQPEAAVPSNFNMISFVAELAGRQSYFGQGAGRYPTAYNVVEDLIDVKNGVRDFYSSSYKPMHMDNSLPISQYYVRCAKPDEWLSSIVAENWETGVLTGPLDAKTMHDWAARKKQEDGSLFIAAVR